MLSKSKRCIKVQRFLLSEGPSAYKASFFTIFKATVKFKSNN
jgi:hypothetical protein